MSNIAIVIPTYNELENIQQLVREIRKNINNSYIVCMKKEIKSN